MLAIREHKKGKNHKALRWLLRAIQQQPKNLKYQKKLPSIYLATYNYKSALRFFDKMIARKGALHPEVASALLEVLFRTHQHKEAMRQIPTLLRKCRRCQKDSNFLFWQARVQEELGLKQFAMRSFADSLSFSLNSSAAVAGKARVAWKASYPKITRFLLKSLKLPKYQTKTLKASIAKTELYITIKDFSAAKKELFANYHKYEKDEYLNRLAGLILLHLGKSDMAEKHFRKALHVWSKDLVSIRGLAHSLDSQNKLKEAVPFYLKAVNLDIRGYDDNARLGRLYYLLKKYDMARVKLRQALDKKDDIASSHYYLACVFEDTKNRDIERIKKHFLRAISISAKREYLYRIARFYYKQRQPKNSIQIYTRLLRKKGLKAKEKNEIYAERGKIFYEMKFWNKALRDFKKLYKKNSQDPKIISFIAACYREKGKKSQAITWYRRTAKIYEKKKKKAKDPTFISVEEQKRKLGLSSIYEKLGDLYRERNRLRQAARWYKKAVYMNPNAYSSYRYLGYLYKDLKRWSRCVRYFKLFLRKAPANHLDRSEVKGDLRACREALY